MLSNEIDSYNFDTIQNNPNLIEILNLALRKSYRLILDHYLKTLNYLLNNNQEHTKLQRYNSLTEIFNNNLYFDLNSTCSTKNLNLFKAIEYLLSMDNFDIKLLASYKPEFKESLNFLNFDFVNSIIPNILLNSNNRID
ncbi:unnamed protein product [Brachionus calyciflorus]|uniref:Uncharacterized protein n=1 Tax=Brachionus calyciflorus TaxID=104777 RepID=A0A814J139_9BILA|nr:unnamed protein product [Brachionus calyciflorus]